MKGQIQHVTFLLVKKMQNKTAQTFFSNNNVENFLIFTIKKYFAAEQAKSKAYREEAADD